MINRALCNVALHIMESNLMLTGIHKDQKNLKQKNTRTISLLTIDDIDAVVSLSHKYFPRSRELDNQTLKRRIYELYFKDGELRSDSSPIVSRSEKGSVNGFLGVKTKPYRYKNSIINVANCHHLVATEDARKQLMPMRLLQYFLAGPQDIFFSDGSSDSTRQLWNRLGGETVTGESIYYKIPLRPVSFAASHLRKLYQCNRTSRVMSSLTGITDSIAGKMSFPLFYRKPVIDIRIVPLSWELMDVLLNKVNPHYLLFPLYDRSGTEITFRLLDGETRFGTLHKSALLDSYGRPIGWFIYYAKKNDVCEVIQAVSIPGKENELFNSLTWHAYSAGGVELSGRLMPSQLQTRFTTHAVTLPARMWTLMRCSDVELKYIIQSGKAFMTRMEGDLWVL